MNLNSYLSPRMMVGAAIVGLVGAAGVIIYEQVYAEKRRAMLVSEVARLDQQLASMRTEVEALRELQKETNLRRVRQKPRAKREAIASGGDATDSEYFTDCQSLIGTDIEMDSEEFYDVPSDEEDTLREPLQNGHVAVDSENNTKSDETKSSNAST
ncbi:unnamed protein product, partial [Brenthis ino]